MPRLTDDIRALIGCRTPLQRCCDVVEAGAVRRFAQAIMDPDPIYADAAHAAGTRYRQPVAPLLFPTAMLRLPFDGADRLQERAADPAFDGAVGSATYGLPQLPLDNSPIVNGAVEVEFRRFAKHGEEVFLEAAYEDIAEKETSKGWMLFVHYDCKYVDRHGELLVRYRRIQVRR